MSKVDPQAFGSRLREVRNLWNVAINQWRTGLQSEDISTPFE